MNVEIETVRTMNCTHLKGDDTELTTDECPGRLHFTDDEIRSYLRAGRGRKECPECGRDVTFTRTNIRDAMFPVAQIRLTITGEGIANGR